MRWTNKHHIDPVIAQAVMTDDYEAVGDISVTRLVRPPQITYLEDKHQDKLVQDVVDGLYMLEGRALHHILALGRRGSFDPEEGQPEVGVPLQEYRLTVDYNGWTISGQFDVLYLETNTLKDYKVSSVWSHILGGKEDHEEQLNFYAYLAARSHIQVDELRVVMWFRDWMASQVERDKQYPPLKVIEHTIPLWALDSQALAFQEKVKLHQLARSGTYPECTPEERWARPDSWAVMKAGAKKAYRVFEEPAMAKAMASSMSGYEVQFRPGEQVRCARYCPVMSFCEQAKKLGVVKSDA
ncbi:hypothetical protein LCGC14_1709210 [marine sediment metagenome]|uniref:PD-(D/E)XK endonuclease-like domain-containing protein n=1 Tax=marine sediment metagenome TaxID=412755 RepID=A0A0F9HF96_9ZZZZ